MKELMDAVKKGNLEEVRNLLNTGLDINTTVSHYLYFEFIPMDSYMNYEMNCQEFGRDRYSRREDKFPQALYKAAMSDNLDIYKLLLSKTNTHLNLNRLLCKVIEDGAQLNDVTRFLIDKIEKIDGNEAFSKTPLHSAAMVGNLNLFKLLIEKFPNSIDIKYKFPISYSNSSYPTFIDSIPDREIPQTPLDCVFLGIKKNYNSFKKFYNHDSNIVKNYIQILNILVSSENIGSYLKAYLIESEILNLYAEVPEFLDLNTLPEEQHKKLNATTLINKIKEIFNKDSDFRKFYIETQTAQVDVVANKGFLNQVPEELKNKWETLYNNLLFLEVKGFIAIKITENNNTLSEVNKENPAAEFPYALIDNTPSNEIDEKKEIIRSLDETDEKQEPTSLDETEHPGVAIDGAANHNNNSPHDDQVTIEVVGNTSCCSICTLV